MQFGGTKKKPQLSIEDQLEEKGYWSAEWICKDCGFIYEPSISLPFEELPKGWKCPQCAGPRRRFAKKAGNVIAKIDDSFIYAVTAFFAIALVGLVVLALQ
jgi:rubredoxin